MANGVSELIVSTEALRKKLLKLEAKQVSSGALKSEIRLQAERYFGDIRPLLRQSNNSEVSTLDELMKSIIELTHKKAARTTYLTKITSAKRILVALDSELATQSAVVQEGTKIHDRIDNLISSTLENMLPSAAASYEQALLDLHSETRKSYRGPATDLREALRETLDHLAPDKEVKAIPGFKQDPNVNGPTMKQKVQYILKMRERPSAQIGSAGATAEMIDEMIGKFVRSVYTRSSVSTHTPTDRTEVLRLRHYVRLALIEILEIRE